MALVDGCTGSCEASAAILAAPQSIWATAYSVLSGIIGTYGVIKQYELQGRMVDIAEQASARADRYLTITEHAYNNITRPTFDRTRALYDRYTTFWPREKQFIDAAFQLREYCPDYKLAEGRAVARVRRIFGQAAQARARSTGRFNTGRACHDASYFAMQSALAATATATAAYANEDRKKFEYDRWYWDRWKAGWSAVSHMGDRGINGLTRGADVVSRGLDDIGRGVAAVNTGAQNVGAAVGNQAAFWGNIGQGGLATLGNALGAGYFDRSPSTSSYPGSQVMDSMDQYAGGSYSGSFGSSFGSGSLKD